MHLKNLVALTEEQINRAFDSRIICHLWTIYGNTFVNRGVSNR